MTRMLLQGDARAMPLADNSADAIVCDPPYGLGLMGKEWDRLQQKNSMQEWHRAWAVEALRVAKPGAYLVAFGGTRTFHRLTCALEDAGWEIRDSIGWPHLEPIFCQCDALQRTEQPHALAVEWIPQGGGVWPGCPRCGEPLAPPFFQGPLAWNYGSGFPKSLDVSKAIDREAGVEREITGFKGTMPDIRGNSCTGDGISSDASKLKDRLGNKVTAPATDAAKQWEGWGTALKPAWEPIILARKPLSETNVAANVLKWGTGALNIDGCRIEGPKGDGVWGTSNETTNPDRKFNASPGMAEYRSEQNAAGRWPANVLFAHAEGCELVGVKQVKGVGHHSYKIPEGGGLYELGLKSLEDKGNPHADAEGMETVEDWRCVPGCPVRLLDEQSGELTSGANPAQRHSNKTRGIYGAFKGRDCFPKRGADSGGASRFFYCAKASRAEREIGMEGVEKKPLHWSSGHKNPGSFQAEGTEKQARNDHPTVKPIDLMAWLCRLVTPPGGLILDPFIGSGSTGIAAAREGFRFVGLDKDRKWVGVSERRISGDSPLLNR